MPARSVRPTDSGFSLVEVMVVLAILGIVSAMGVGAWRAWALSSAHKGTASAIQSTLRNAQVRAVSEGMSFCVQFDTAADTYSVSRYACDDHPVLVEGPYHVEDPRVHLNAALFTAPDGSASTGVTFRPTGSAWPGSVRVIREGSALTYTLTVEGFTGRVTQQ